MKMSAHRARWIAAAASVALAGGTLLTHTSSVHAETTLTVHPGQSIQAAIDKAAAGTTINIESGTYAENLNIPTDGITLAGDGADDVRLIPPASVAPFCGETSSSVIGICVAHVVGFDPTTGPITQTVHNVHISGLTIKGFTDSGIFILDSTGTRVSNTHSMNNGGYGVFALQSTGVRYSHNEASGNHEAGLYIGDSPHADAWVTDNRSTGNGIGVFFRDSRGVHISDNTLTGNCVGLVFLNTGSLPSGDGDAWVTDTNTNRNTLACPPGDGPPVSGIGVLAIGADHISLRDGTANGNQPSGGSFASGGIVLSPSHSQSPTPTTHVTVDDYTAKGNSTDIVVLAPDATNKFTDLTCGTSSPAGIC